MGLYVPKEGRKKKQSKRVEMLNPKLLITFFAGRRRSERIPFQTGQARANGITRHAETRIACEVAELIGCGVAGGARKRADASVGWLG